jgi:hypothetical protein
MCWLWRLGYTGHHALTIGRWDCTRVQLEQQVRELQESKAAAAMYYKQRESLYEDSMPALQKELRQRTDLFDASAAESHQQIVRPASSIYISRCPSAKVAASGFRIKLMPGSFHVLGFAPHAGGVCRRAS